jgi:arabinofuranosyltransferase
MPEHWGRVALVVLALVFTAGSLLALASRYGVATVGRSRFWLLDDDFMISQRYARNLARGDGLVFNRGERVEGFSNPLTVLAISFPLELLDVDRSRLGLYVTVINAIPHALILLLLLPGDGGKRDAYGIGAAAVYLTLPHHGFFSHAGLEVYWQALCLLAVSIGVTRQRGGVLYPAMSLLPLVHPADVPTWLGAAVIRLHQQKGRRLRELACLLATTLPLLAFLAFRMAYYGELVPNTFLLKASGVFMRRRGLHYVMEGATAIWPTLLLLAAGLFRQVRMRRLLPIVLVLFGPYLLSVIKLGGDTIASHRLIFVIVPAILFFSAESLRGTAGTWRRAALLGGLALQLLVTAGRWPVTDDADRQILGWEAERTALGLAIRANTAADQTIALFGTGLAGYFGDRPVIDMLGKTDPHIAQTTPRLWRQVAHQKSDPAYVLARHPDFVEMPFTRKQVQDDGFLRRQSRGRWGYVAELALEPSFRASYLPVPTRGRDLPLWRRSDLPERVWDLRD